MRSVWHRWTSYLDQEMDPTPLALVRIALPLVVIVDLARLIHLDLVDHVFVPYSAGGLSKIQDPHWILPQLLGDAAATLALGLTLVCMSLVAIGKWMRQAILIGVLAYAQLGHLFPPGMRQTDSSGVDSSSYSSRC